MHRSVINFNLAGPFGGPRQMLVHDCGFCATVGMAAKPTSAAGGL
jgi:hypothetical protein